LNATRSRKRHTSEQRELNSNKYMQSGPWVGNADPTCGPRAPRLTPAENLKKHPTK
ncbi:hypothetical protein JYU34_000718, partial [Plutella xylostella]